MVWALYRRWRLGSQPGADVLVRIELVEESRRSGEGRNTALLRCRCHLANVCCSLIRKVILDKINLLHACRMPKKKTGARKKAERQKERQKEIKAASESRNLVQQPCNQHMVGRGWDISDVVALICNWIK